MKKNADDNLSFTGLIFMFALIIFGIKIALDFGGVEKTDFLNLAGATLLIISLLLFLFKGVIVGLIEAKVSSDKAKIENIFKNTEAELEKIDMFTGIEFEKYIVSLLKKEGYTNIKSTKASGDYGVDIVAQKDDLKCAIQCKRYHNNIPIKAIQEIKAGKIYYKCDKAMVITNSYYTQNAKNLASSIGVQLFDRDDLIRIIKKHNSN